MKNWKKIADGNNLGLSESDLERIAPALDALESTFRPLSRSIPDDVEPAVTFVIHLESGE